MLRESALFAATFVVFGYAEHTWRMGFMMANILTALWYTNGASILFPLLSAVETVLYLKGFRSASFGIFTLLSLVYFYDILPGNSGGDGSPDSDCKVGFRPMEKEIRAFLFKKDPSILHQVDRLLDENKGRERQLFEELVQKYERSDEPGDEEAEEEAGDAGSSSSYAVPSTQPVAVESSVRVAAAVNPVAAGSSAPTQTISWETKFKELYLKYDPLNFHRVGSLLEMYVGREEEMYSQMCRRFGAAERLQEAAAVLPEHQRVKRSLNEVVREIYDVISVHAPQLQSSLAQLLHSNAGREEQLLRELKEEYDLPPVTFRTAPPGGQSYQDFAKREEVDNALWETREAIRRARERSYQ